MGIDYSYIVNHDIAFVDLDGTIIDQNGLLIPGVNNYFSILPYKKYIATGRNVTSLLEISELSYLIKLFEKYIVCYNGNAIYNILENELEVIDTLGFIDGFIKYLVSKKIDFIIDNGGVLHGNSKKAATKYAIYTGVSRSKINVVNFMGLNLDKVLLMHIYTENLLTKSIKKYFLKEIDINTDFLPQYLIIYPRKTDKSKGVKYILEKLQFKNKRIISFGNDTNDIGLFQISHTGVAVHESDRQLIEVANYHLDTSFSEVLENIYCYMKNI